MISQAILKDLPNGTELLESQVAGHTFRVGSDEIGMLKDQKDGSVLKAANKPICGAREIKFYECLESDSTDATIKTLRQFVPEYHGTVRMSFRGKTIDFIKLTDTTHDMREPCVMDIKIGKRTWDPLATPEKVLAEEEKYEACKQHLGFCIPGFQVYDIKSGRVKRFGKEYGKKLNQNSVKEALRIFLNADTQLSKVLVMKFLSTLWSIQAWVRSQTSLRFYSSSLLLAYDAKRLKSEIFSTTGSRSATLDYNSKLTSTVNRDTKSFPPNTNRANETNNANGCYKGDEDSFSKTHSIQHCNRLQNNHSTQNKHEEGMENIHEHYEAYLDNSNEEYHPACTEEWAFVKMIDFAHVFPADDATIDTNYLFGIENLVKLFEEFLRECD